MPKSLLDRCGPDSVNGFRDAAETRFADGLAIEGEGRERRTGAIYLWGYAAEMTIKAAYFATIGFDDDRAITMRDLRDAANVGLASTIDWPSKGKLHNVRAWAELLSKVRSSTPGLAYPDPSFGDRIVSMGRRLEPLWSEELRYHSNVAYEHESRRVRDAAGWFLIHSSRL